MQRNNGRRRRSEGLVASRMVKRKPKHLDTSMLDSSLQLGKAFQPESVNKILKRFDRLPIHKICYSQCSTRSELVLRKMKKAIAPNIVRDLFGLRDRAIESGTRQDCLGMTPLHILACSTKHDVELYELLCEKYPGNLVTADIWGNIPLVHALMGNAPQHIVELLVDRHKLSFPEHANAIDWTGIVEAVGRASYGRERASASPTCIKNVLAVRRHAFPNSNVDWEKALTRWASEDTKQASKSNVRKFHSDAFQYLMSYSILDRLKKLSVPRWRTEILNDINQLPWFVFYREKSTNMIYEKLAHYEHMNELREATTLLELALWKKARFDGGHCDMEGYTDVYRIKSGADLIVPNILAFLVP